MKVVSIKPDNLPDGSKLKDYREYIVQDLIIGNWNTCYRRQRWQTPSGEYVLGNCLSILPAAILDRQ